MSLYAAVSLNRCEHKGPRVDTLTFGFKLDSAVPLRSWFSKNETYDSTRSSIVDATSLVVGECGADKHTPLQPRVRTENAEEYTCWAKLVEIIVDREGGLHGAKRTPWEGFLVRI